MHQRAKLPKLSVLNLKGNQPLHQRKATPLCLTTGNIPPHRWNLQFVFLQGAFGPPTWPHGILSVGACGEEVGTSHVPGARADGNISVSVDPGSVSHLVTFSFFWRVLAVGCDEVLLGCLVKLVASRLDKEMIHQVTQDWDLVSISHLARDKHQASNGPQLQS